MLAVALQNIQSGQNKIQLWETATAELRRNLKGQGGEISSLAFSPDGKTLASGSSDTTIKLWDVAAADPKPSFNKP
jgi:WD40 repeat protein